MSDFKRLISRRERARPSRDKIQSPDGTDNLLGLFGDEKEKHRTKIADKDLEKKVKEVQDLLSKEGITKYREQEIEFVLKSSYIAGDVEKAFQSLALLQDSEDGIIRSYDPKVKLKGAVNHNGVSCYLDSILFAMFGRLESFEAMLYNSFEDPKKSDLSTLLRLWVNTVRSGKLVEADLTKRIQDTLAACGWSAAAKDEQQDASEAFSFITDKLNLPMLTLKMDLFHHGKNDDKDDHKFIRERLLEVAVPDDKKDGQTITLEDCLETYFNSRVEVKRYLERTGTGSLQGSNLNRSAIDSEKLSAIHVESIEMPESGPATPIDSYPTSLPSYTSVRPSPFPHKPRAPSIIQETIVYDDEKAALKADLNRKESMTKGGLPGRPRAGTLRKEVMMPAWQFFSLIPWYTEIAPNNDAQIEAHLQRERPVLGICLKRYTYTNAGEAVRRGTHIDVPIEIGLPHFIHDDTIDENAAAFGNFKLSLQSVVCHRGKSVYEGHYISLVRTTWPDGEDKWVRFDDLAPERVCPVDIAKALKEESPYLLFYQIQPIEDPEDISRSERPPSYMSDAKDSAIAGFSDAPSIPENASEIPTSGFSTGRPSLEVPESARIRGRTSFTGERRSSIALSSDLPRSDASNARPSASRQESRHSKYSSHSRANSATGERRLSKSFQVLAGKLTALNPSLSKVDSIPAGNDVPVIEPSAYAENVAKPLPIKMDPLSDHKARLRKDKDKKSEKSEKLDKPRDRSALGSGQLTKGKKAERPDRECSVM